MMGTIHLWRKAMRPGSAEILEEQRAHGHIRAAASLDEPAARLWRI
jgi:hypothetical protein